MTARSDDDELIVDWTSSPEVRSVSVREIRAELARLRERAATSERETEKRDAALERACARNARLERVVEAADRMRLDLSVDPDDPLDAARAYDVVRKELDHE